MKLQLNVNKNDGNKTEERVWDYIASIDGADELEMVGFGASAEDALLHLMESLVYRGFI